MQLRRRRRRRRHRRRAMRWSKCRRLRARAPLVVDWAYFLLTSTTTTDAFLPRCYCHYCCCCSAISVSVFCTGKIREKKGGRSIRGARGAVQYIEHTVCMQQGHSSIGSRLFIWPENLSQNSTGYVVVDESRHIWRLLVSTIPASSLVPNRDKKRPVILF